ncbi:MAG: hypothetical protein M0Z36_00635 [Thermaerobacter sp.]|nr:hypothetical protein [Thermaerobacter sp.]
MRLDQFLSDFERWAVTKNEVDRGVSPRVLASALRHNQRVWREFWLRALAEYIQEHDVLAPELIRLIEWGIIVSPTDGVPSRLDWKHIATQFNHRQSQVPQWLIMAPIDTGGAPMEGARPYQLDDGLWLVPPEFEPIIEARPQVRVSPAQVMNELSLRYFDEMDRLNRIADNAPAAYLVRTVPVDLLDGQNGRASRLQRAAFADVARGLSALRLASSGFVDAPYIMETAQPLELTNFGYQAYANAYYARPWGEQPWPAVGLAVAKKTAQSLYDVMRQIPCIESPGLLPKAELHFTQQISMRVRYGEQWEATTWLEFVLGMFGLTYGRSTLETVVNSWVAIEALVDAKGEKAAHRAIGLLTHNVPTDQQYEAFASVWAVYEKRNGVAHGRDQRYRNLYANDGTVARETLRRLIVASLGVIGREPQRLCVKDYFVGEINRLASHTNPHLAAWKKQWTSQHAKPR